MTDSPWSFALAGLAIAFQARTVSRPHVRSADQMATVEVALNWTGIVVSGVGVVVTLAV